MLRMNEEKVPFESTRPPQLIQKLKEEDDSKRKLNWKEVLKEIFILIFIVGLVFIFRIYVAEPYLVNGLSMDPTFKSGNYLIVEKISKKAKNPERNSVIVFKYPDNPSKNFIKRVIGLPGETVIVKDNSTTIINQENPNGFLLEQDYVVHKGTKDTTLKLGEDEYFVMGDNRQNSLDSRYWGGLKKEYILGIPVIQLMPANDIKIMPGSI